VRLREDYLAEALRRLAKRSKDANQSRRLLSLAAIGDGMDRCEAARIGGLDRQTLRDWVHRFNVHGRSHRQLDGRAEAASVGGSVGGIGADD
jgi:hypothetical protein